MRVRDVASRVIFGIMEEVKVRIRGDDYIVIISIFYGGFLV